MTNKISCTLDDVARALTYLDESDQQMWVRMGMAIKREYGDAGFDVWDGWGQGYPDYKPREARTRWKSFHVSGARGSVGIGSLFHLAMQRGFTFEHDQLSPEEKARLAAESEARREALAAQWAQDEAYARRWHQVVADAAAKLLPLLKSVGNSPYLGKKKIHSSGCYFAPCSFVLFFKPDFCIDIIAGEATREFFDFIKSEKQQGIEHHFLYFKRGSILIPMLNMAGELRNFQIIYNDGKSKRFLTNGQKSGLFYVIGDVNADLSAPILFAEGFATAASQNMAVFWPTVVCFDAGNMVEVAKEWAHVNRLKIFAGDNDWKTALDPKKKNTGLLKAQEAAAISGGYWCVPLFSDDEKSAEMFGDKGPSDFNDLHAISGLQAVKLQLLAALESARPLPGATLIDSPPDYGDIPLPDELNIPGDESFDSDSPPAPSITAAQLSIDEILRRYALTEPDSKVWDTDKKKLIKTGAFKNIVKPKLYAEWLNHENRRTVSLDDVIPQIAVAQKKGRGGLGEALRRYVYLNPSDTVWDRETRELVAVSHLKIAIADCYMDWVTHPEREEIPARNLVFDPTQKCNPKTHINQFKGLAARPVHNDKLCERIVRMLFALCNNDRAVFKWLRRWLAYPLINVGAKMETAVLCHSDVHGSGKSYFFDVVMRAIYGEYSRTVGQAQLEGQYNDWMSKVLYCVYEEVLSRSQRYSHTGTIKQTITGKTVRIEKKFMSGWEEANHMNSVFLSNEVLPLPVEPSDRRFLVIWPETKLYEELQRGVDEDLKQGGAAAFYHFLLNTKLQDPDEPYPFNEHTKPPMTEAKQRLIEHGRAIWEVFYYEWEQGYLEVKGNKIPYCCIRINDLFRLFGMWCNQNNEHSMGAHKFGSFISSKLKRRRDLHYNFLNAVGKATFYIVGEKPEDKTQEQWLGACVHEIERLLNASSDQDRQAA